MIIDEKKLEKEFKQNKSKQNKSLVKTEEKYAIGKHPNSVKTRLNLEKISKEKAREIRSLGGKARQSPEVKEKVKANKTFKEILQQLMSHKIADVKIKEACQAKFPDLDPEELSYKIAIAAAVVKKSTDGDIRAIEFSRDTIGEKPSDSLDITTLGQSMQPVFNITPIAVKDKIENNE